MRRRHCVICSIAIDACNTQAICDRQGWANALLVFRLPSALGVAVVLGAFFMLGSLCQLRVFLFYVLRCCSVVSLYSSVVVASARAQKCVCVCLRLRLRFLVRAVTRGSEAPVNARGQASAPASGRKVWWGSVRVYCNSPSAVACPRRLRRVAAAEPGFSVIAVARCALEGSPETQVGLPALV